MKLECFKYKNADELTITWPKRSSDIPSQWVFCFPPDIFCLWCHCLHTTFWSGHADATDITCTKWKTTSLSKWKQIKAKIVVM